MTLLPRFLSFIRSQKCYCMDREHWPWRRNEKCARCELLQAYAEAEIVQKPGVLVCSHEYAREAGRCLGCGETV